MALVDSLEAAHYDAVPRDKNPTHDKLTITSHADGIELVEIYDIQGTLFIRQAVDGLHTIVDLSHLPAGVYISRVDAGGRSVFREVVKLR